MDSNTIWQGHHAQISLLRSSPEPDAPIRLLLDAKWILDHADAFLFRQISPLAHDLLFEVGRESKGRHSSPPRDRGDDADFVALLHGG
jgi:hypothetical protein